MKLRIIDRIVGEKDVQTAEVTTRALQSRAIIAEGQLFESQIGRTPYSEFLTSRGRYPSPEQTETMGRLIGLRLMANDGAYYPALTTTEKRTQREEKLRARAQTTLYTKSRQAGSAIRTLASLTEDAEAVFAELSGDEYSGFVPKMLDSAISCLLRFAEEMNRDGRQEYDFVAKFTGRSRAGVGS